MARASITSDGLLIFDCPGCGCAHGVGVNGRKVMDEDGKPCEWQWNQSLTTPTLNPSILVGKKDAQRRCHSFVVDGRIRFLSDCYHNLKGQTVDLPDWE